MTSPLTLLLALQETSLGGVISKSPLSVGFAAQLLHITGFTLLLSSTVLLNLRLLGWLLPSVPLKTIFRPARALHWTGLAFAVGSGSLIFISFVNLYYFNPAFQLKVVLLLLASLLQLVIFKGLAHTSDTPGWALKASALLSLVLWFSIGLAGRAIGFV